MNTEPSDARQPTIQELFEEADRLKRQLHRLENWQHDREHRYNQYNQRVKILEADRTSIGKIQIYREMRRKAHVGILIAQDSIFRTQNDILVCLSKIKDILTADQIQLTGGDVTRTFL